MPTPLLVQHTTVVQARLLDFCQGSSNRKFTESSAAFFLHFCLLLLQQGHVTSRWRSPEEEFELTQENLQDIDSFHCFRIIQTISVHKADTVST